MATTTAREDLETMHQFGANTTVSPNQLLNHISTCLLVIDDQFRILQSNNAAEHMLSASQNKLSGAVLRDVLRFPEAFEKRLRDAFATAHNFREHEIDVILPHLQTESLIDCAVSIGTGNDRSSRWLLLEITERSQQARVSREQALARQHQTSHALMRELAHEIKNPLGGLRGAAQLLESELPDAALTEYTRIIVAEADRLRSLIDRVMGPTKQPSYGEVNVHQVLEQVRQLSLNDSQGTLRINQDYDPSIPALWADSDWLTQILLNIVQNAAQAIGDEGTITLKTRIRRAFTIGTTVHRLVAAIHIIDDGPGIPEAIRDTLFFPMVSGRDQGSGLGLSIAQDLVARLNGLISCESSAGNTVFSIYLPLESRPFPELHGAG